MAPAGRGAIDLERKRGNAGRIEHVVNPQHAQGGIDAAKLKSFRHANLLSPGMESQFEIERRESGE